MPLKNRPANLTIFPKVIDNTSNHVSLGDMHGNALKLIYTMIEEGVLALKDEPRRDVADGIRRKKLPVFGKYTFEGLTADDKYQILRNIYNTPVNQLTLDDLNAFQYLINKADVHIKKSVTLIGDELADRGNNDYFTLLVLQRLKKSDVNIDIILSNHSVEFIRDYEHREFTGVAHLGRGQGQSLTNMRGLIQKNLIKEDDVRKIVNEVYKPMVKAISYTITPEGDITLFSHAPIGLETIKALAAKFKLPYRDSTPIELITTINSINIHVQQLFADKKLAALIDKEGPADPYNPVPPESQPLQRLVWNRGLGNELVTKPNDGIASFKVNFVHGHIGDGEILKNGRERLPTHQNLDTSFGKYPEFGQTGYSPELRGKIEHFTRQSDELTAKELTPEKLTEIAIQYSKKIPAELAEIGLKNDMALIEAIGLQNKKIEEEKLLKSIQLEFEMRQLYQNQFDSLLLDLEIKTKELTEKGTKGKPTFDPKYVDVGKESFNLISSLTKASEQFFKSPTTEKTLIAFADECTTSINNAKKSFKEHRRSFDNWLPVFKQIAVFFAFLWQACNPTKSAEKLQVFKMGLEQTDFIKLKQQLQQAKEQPENQENKPDAPSM